MPATLVYRFEARGAEAWLHKVNAFARDPSPAMAEISAVLAADVERSFELERDPETGVPWARLRAETIRERAEQGYWPGKILQRTGQLAASYERSHGRDFAAVASTKVQAAILNYGGTIKPKNGKALHFRGRTVSKVVIPARRVLAISKDGNDDIVSILDRYLKD